MSDARGANQSSVHDQITVRGNASAEELAAVLALLAHFAQAPSASARPEGYARWRQGRLAAIRSVGG